MKKTIKVAFAGNPNCGKTTLFNALTGANLKVANWPGVTVERKEGTVKYEDYELKLVDLPGIYSITSYSLEEKVSRKCILEEDVDVIVNVVDASSMERNLYLTLQLLELGKPVILALNMMDIVKERGMEIDLHRLPELLGSIPIVPVSARKRVGMDVLLHAVVHHYEEEPPKEVVTYHSDIETSIKRVSDIISKKYPDLKNLRWYSIKVLENDEEVLKNLDIESYGEIPEHLEKEIINQKYEYIEGVMEECLFYKDRKEESTEKVDRILTHPFWGVPIFLGIMAIVFFLTFTIGDFIKGGFEWALEIFSNGVSSLLLSIGASGWASSLLVGGVITGVGGILTFLPNLIILFFALALLEDSGYMARVAYVMDGIMGKVGLSGKAFLPMVLGFGCTVPAVMAARSLERESDRKKTIFITPFMSCSARLPIYVLFSNMFFGKFAMLAAFSMYVIGLVVSILLALVVSRFGKHKEDDNQSLLIELPEYKAPNARTILIYVWEKVKDYLTKAGTTIFMASVIIWFILNFNIHGLTDDVSQSFGAQIGKALVPIFKPAGLGMWQIIVALISGLSAKEVVVSSFAVLFGVEAAGTATGMSHIASSLSAVGFGPLNAYAFMVFCLLYTPCAAAVGTIKKETNGKFTAGIVVFQMVFAWVCSVLVYQVGSFIIGLF